MTETLGSDADARTTVEVCTRVSSHLAVVHRFQWEQTQEFARRRATGSGGYAGGVKTALPFATLRTSTAGNAMASVVVAFASSTARSPASAHSLFSFLCRIRAGTFRMPGVS
ncbi:hypothetical protein EJ110_NYTH07664 [Nymphaea thermarum]|nr:hypothetical protein EJ110_NYTH07664 [Nymphaea thermarum]